MEAYLDQLYALLPRANRATLHSRLLADPNFEFRNGPDTPRGRYFAIAVGDYPAPAAQLPLSRIIRAIEPDNEKYTDKIRAAAFILRNYMHDELHMIVPELPAAGGGGERRPRASRRTHRKVRKAHIKSRRVRKARK